MTGNPTEWRRNSPLSEKCCIDEKKIANAYFEIYKVCLAGQLKVNAKIQNLLDYHLRLLHGVVPPPSGHDIASTLKYFSQTLLGVLKDIQTTPLKLLRHLDQDSLRLSLFPSLDYKGLHEALTQLVDVIPLVQFGTHAMGQGLLHTICCLVVFLERDCVDMLPYLVASMMTSIPESLHQNVVDALTYIIFPFTIGTRPSDETEDNYADASIPAILMTVFQYSKNTSHHSQLLECLMGLKKDLIKDLFSIIAHGTPTARPAAANLLFYYWPNFNPTLYERKGFHIRIADISSVLKAMFNKSAQAAKTDSISQTDSGESKSPKGWKRLICQLEECEGEGQNEASKVCYDLGVALGACPESPPPLYVCKDCAATLASQNASIELEDMKLPMGMVAATCDNRNCRSTEKNAVATCFSTECISNNANRPIRYCPQCNTIKHNTRRGMDHMVHTVISSVWNLDLEFQNYVIEAIVSLLNEAQPLGDKVKAKDQERLSRACLLEEESVDALTMEDRRTLSRNGVWLIVGLCVPTDETPIPVLGRLLGSLCHWFSATQYVPDDQQGVTIERLKTDYIHNWLLDVCKTHFDVFVSCLLPHPVDYAKVGGHWDTLATKSEHIKEGFRRLFCLVPYDLITLTVWEKVMPHWLEAIHNDVPEKDLLDLKITLSKLLDPEMSPLGFDATQMYTFIAKRFMGSNEAVQEQTLSWLQLLTSLSISIPIYQLMEMFQDGVKSLIGKKTDKKEDASKAPPLEPVIEDGSDGEGGEWEERRNKKSYEDAEEEQTPPEKTLTCFILMFDVFLKQLEVQEIEKHKGVNGPVGIPFLTLTKDMLHSPCLAPHTCNGDQYCTTCDLTITFFQLTMDILAYLLPLLAIQNNRVADMIPPEPKTSQVAKSGEGPMVGLNGSSVTKPPLGEPLGSVGKNMKDMAYLAELINMPQIVTATVETVGELDIVANMPQEQVLPATATAVTITEEDVAHAKAVVDKASVVGVNDEPIDCTKPIDVEEDSFWVTSQGKFKFKLEQLPPHLQVIYALLQLLEKAEDGDVVCHLCECLRYLILHGESLAQAAADHRGFLIWCQEHKNINLMWTLLEAEWSHVAEICVALLLHFLTLPCGADIFWKLCENHFHHHDWKVRFQAVEKVVVIGRFLTVASVKQCPGLQAAIAHAFCFLLASLDDINMAVAQRAHLYLTSLCDSGLRALSWCLEQQFDSVILDRPMIIQALHQLSSLLPDRKILTWEFFYNRFDALYIEAQIALEKHGDIAFPRDLRNSDLTSDIFARKLSRAQDALSLVQNASAKTLSSSLGTKWPYKRTMSAPANMFNRIDKQERSIYRVDVESDKDKNYCRQYSAPLLKRGISKTCFATAGDAGMKVFDDGSMVHQLQQAMDLEETDFDTLHLLVFLLMHFFSDPQHTAGEDDKGNAKVMNLVLRHLSVMMGYSSHEKSFTIMPARLRCSPMFNAFLSSLPQVLDHNFNMGKLLLPTCMPVLQFSPAPHRMVDIRFPTYSLWCLQPHPRRWWLTSVLTIMYKFDYTRQLLSSQIISLIRIVLFTLENHFHRCKKAVDPASLSYSREVSQGSLGGEGEGAQDATPPASPNAGTAGGGSAVATTSNAQEQSRGIYGTDHKSAFTPVLQDQRNGCDYDKSLCAIPESPKVEMQESLSELVPYEEVVFGEQATIRIERQASPEILLSEANVVTPPIASSVIVPQTVKSHGVTSVMASQIQAFDESFTVKILDAQLVRATPFEASSETISLDDNNHSWSTDLDQLALLSGSDQSLELACMQSSAVAVSISNEQEQSKEVTVVASGQRTSSSQHPTSSYIFQPISSTSRRDSSTRERKSSIASVKESSTNIVCVQAVQVQEAVVVSTAVTHQAQIVEPHGIQTIIRETARAIEPRIIRIQSTETHGNNQKHFSPQSPLSMMDLITLGSPIEVDGHTGIVYGSPGVDHHSPKVLELPTPERLLQVGREEGITIMELEKMEDTGQDSILERVWHSFEGWTNSSKSSVNNGDSSLELHEVITVKDKSTSERQQKAVLKKNGSQKKLEQSRHGQISTDEISDISNTITASSDRELTSKSETNKSSNRSRCWEDLGTNYYSWSEPSEGLSAKGGKGPQPPCPPSSTIKQSSLRVGEDCMVYRCMECGEALEQFSNEDLGMCIIILSTFVHREPGLAAPLLPRMLKTVARVAGSEVFTWQYESPIHLPGSATSIGRQFLRCILHQLAPNQIFNQIFQSDIQDIHKMKLFKTLAQALTDFNELNPSAPIQLLLENLNSVKNLPTENLGHILGNVAAYMECATQEGNVGLSSSLVPLFDTFLRKVQLNVACVYNYDNLMRLLINVLRVQGIAGHKSILDPVSKLLSYSIQNSPLKFEHLCELCYLCSRIFARERDKLLLARLVIFELVQALRFKTMIPDTNIVLIVQLLLQDSGGTLGSNNILDGLPQDIVEGHSQHNTNTAECMRSHLHDALEFIADVHTISKVKSSCRSSSGLHEDTLGGLIKAGIAQYLAIEITRGNSRDSRTIAKYLPWLQSAPTAIQQGPKEFIECVVHIRLLSWLLLGSLTHTCLVGPVTSIQCQPVPPEASCHIADHIQVILAGFPEHSKNTVQHMSSLYQTFILCQLWTLYLEQGAGTPACETHSSISAILADFWAKITPAILQLVSHSKVLGEMVALHLMSLMEALQECQSSVLTKLLPLWAPILYSQHAKVPGQLLVRLRSCQDASPPTIEKMTCSFGSLGQATTSALPFLSRWLHRLQFKMGQIELQSSSAAIQFYSV